MSDDLAKRAEAWLLESAHGLVDSEACCYPESLGEDHASLTALLRAVAAEERGACAACCDEPTSLSADQRTRETIVRRIRARGER